MMRWIARPLEAQGPLRITNSATEPSLALVGKVLPGLACPEIPPEQTQGSANHGGAEYSFFDGWTLHREAKQPELPPYDMLEAATKAFATACNRVLQGPMLVHNAIRDVSYPYEAEIGAVRPALELSDGPKRRKARRKLVPWLTAEYARLKLGSPHVPFDGFDDPLGRLFERLVARLNRLDRPYPMVWALEDTATVQEPHLMLVLPDISWSEIILSADGDKLQLDEPNSSTPKETQTKIAISHALAAAIAIDSFEWGIETVRVKATTVSRIDDFSANDLLVLFDLAIGPSLRHRPPKRRIDLADITNFEDCSISLPNQKVVAEIRTSLQVGSHDESDDPKW